MAKYEDYRKSRSDEVKQTKEEKLRAGFKKWTSFYRANIHRFIEDYFGLRLHLFQKIIIYMMDNVLFSMYLAARGQGKSFIIALYCCARCVLYPNTQIVIASGIKKQAELIITEKIKKILREASPSIDREILDIKEGKDCYVTFKNGSTITAVTSNDNARGFRCNLLILDEFRLIKKDVVNKVLRQFLNVNRQPPYLKNSKYAHLVEENKEVYISSPWYKSNWMWDKFKSFSNSQLKSEDHFVCVLPYQLSLHHGLLSKRRAEAMQAEDDFDPIAWMIEMDCLFVGQSENAFFNLNEIDKCRTLIKSFYPLTTYEFLSKKKTNFPRQKGEIRAIGVDVALMGGTDNDNTVFTCVRMIPEGDGFTKHVCYIETIHGKHTQLQAVRLKQLYSDFEADYVVMDTLGNGLSLYDDCAKVLYDEERDIEYPAWSAFNDEKMKSRALDDNALEVVFSIKVVQAEVNHKIAMWLRSDIEKGKIKFLIDELNARGGFSNKEKFAEKTPEEQALLLKPFFQTTALVNEMINLEAMVVGGFYKVKEANSRARKDRYSSLAYVNYYLKILEMELKRKEKVENINASDYMLIRKGNIYAKR